MRCTQCKNRVLQKSQDGVKLRTQGPIVFTTDGLCKSQCYWCKSEVVIPISLAQEVASEPERFVLKK